MILIDDKLVSDEIVTEYFVCDLNSCKGGCCVDGDAGAPLENSELRKIKEVYEYVEPWLTEEGKAAIKEQGPYTHDEEFGWVTPVNPDGMCAYAFKDKKGIVKCSIEHAWREGKHPDKLKDWKKPISCHLFPIRIKETSRNYLLNFEPRPGLCDPGCKLGTQLKTPAYKFLKEPLTRKFGEEFFEALEATAGHIQESH